MTVRANVCAILCLPCLCLTGGIMVNVQLFGGFTAWTNWTNWSGLMSFCRSPSEQVVWAPPFGRPAVWAPAFQRAETLTVIHSTSISAKHYFHQYNF